LFNVECDDGAIRKVVMTGDLGRYNEPIIHDPSPVEDADYIVVESTYGNRLHRPLDATLDELVVALERTLKGARGNVVIPSFAVGRTQELLFVLTRLTREGRLHGLNVHVDSPMALAATEVTLRHPELLDGEAHELMAWQKGHPKDPRIHFVQDVEESMALNTVRGDAIVISASGMCEAGRIKYHLLHNLPRPECAIVIVGFQAQHTLGRRIVERRSRIRIFGVERDLNAEPVAAEPPMIASKRSRFDSSISTTSCKTPPKHPSPAKACRICSTPASIWTSPHAHQPERPLSRRSHGHAPSRHPHDHQTRQHQGSLARR
jgi:Cft2 family RNA processing exonuclease